MANRSLKAGLERAKALEDYKRSIQTRYTHQAQEKFVNSRILPFIIALISTYSYFHEKASWNKANKKYKEHDDIETEALQWNRTVANWTVVLGIVSALGLIVSFEALRAIQGQLNEMRSGSADTHALAQAAVNQAKAAEQAAQTAHDNLIASERAWIGPTGASLDTLVPGASVKAHIPYANSGHEPATNIQFSVSIDAIAEDVFEKDWGKQRAEQSEMDCFSITSTYGGVAYPEGHYQVNVDKSPDKNRSQTYADSLIDGTGSALITGCFSYVTQGMIKHSAFCYFYKKEVSEIGSLNFCSWGNRAD